MDDRRFDFFVRELATGTSRRRLLRGLVGGSATFLTVRGGSSLAAAKVTICHWNGSTYDQISVSQNAVSAHQRHQDGLDIIDPDFLSSTETCGDCNTRCSAVDACTPAACVDGACNTEPACTENSSCVDGTCSCDEGYERNEAGDCVPVTPCVPNCDGMSCGQPDGCGDTCKCAAGRDCLENGTCAQPCEGNDDCDSPCYCLAASQTDSRYCAVFWADTQDCESDATCPFGFMCETFYTGGCHPVC